MPRGAKSVASEMDEGELCDAIRNIRDNDEADKRSRRMPVGDADLEPLTTVALLGMLQQMEQGKSLTLAHVKKADMNVKKMKAEEERALVDEEESELNADEEDGSEGSEQITMTETNGPTSRVSGDGTREATIRQPTFFLIEACDAKGKRITTGGESWAIAIRGPSQPRARVTDHGDGTYLVIWKPYVSGKYEIAVSHVPARTRFDELGAPLSNALPGSPFICEATPTIPCPSKCIVRGDHLTSAISRETHYFEVLFKDRLGQVAHAVDLDVYVEPISVSSPRNRHSPQTEAEAAEAAAAAALAEDEQGQRKKKTKDKKSGVKGQGAGQPPPPPAMLPAPGVLAEASDVAEESSVHGPKVRRNSIVLPGTEVRRNSIVPPGTEVRRNSIVLPGTEVRRKSIMLPSLAPSTNELAKPSNAPNDVTTKHRLMRVKVGEKPLLVRAKVDKESQQIGRILPGQVVTIVEERIAEDGEVRACIALDSVALSVDGSRPSKFSPLNSPTSVTASPAPEPERVDTPPPDLEGTSEEQRSAQTSGDDMKTGQGPGTGWVTLVKEGRKLVTSRVKLGPGARRQFVQQWARRKANDVVSRRRGGVTVNELTSDPTGIGFGFGGVQPGTLHAHGQLHEVHRVSYSIGLAGQYLMHVRLRQQATAVPGSPFNLTVVPGTADAKTTKLDSTAPLRGMVGLTGPDVGCSLGLHTADKMGNPCIVGGAAVRISVDHEDVEADVIDNNDGTYKLQWRSKYSGTFRTRVMVEAGGASEDVVGSPMEFTLTSSTPELSKSDLLGDGLRHSIAGVTALIKIKFVDQFANTAIPGPSFKFGMSIGKDKDKVANAKPHDFTGEWEAGDTGIYEIMYTPTLAGSNELHVWCDPNSKGERLSFPGSPFHVTVTPGAASPDVSVIEQWTKLQKEEKNDKYGKSAASDPGTIHAGDTVSIRPQIFDLYGNPTTLPESGLDVVHKLPDGHVTGLGYTTQQRGGLTSYDIRHDTTYAGAHEIDVLLNGVSIKGSPVCFSVMPDKPDPTNCKLTVPLELTAAGEKGTMYTNTPYACTLKAFDKFDNECKMGGLTLSTRLQVVKQGVHDQTTLVPSNHSCEWVDNGDGTYSIHMTMNVMCAVKLFINMDKNLPAGAGELPSIHLPFLSNPPDDTKDAAMSKVLAAVAPSESKTSKNEKLKAAAGEIMEGFGLAEDRREKDALVVAAEAFADATSFAFDKPPASPSMKRRSSMAPIPLGKDSSTPNPNLFERALTSGSGKSDKR